MNIIEEIGESHWRSDWNESPNDEMALVARPNRIMLHFNLFTIKKIKKICNLI